MLVVLLTSAAAGHIVTSRAPTRMWLQRTVAPHMAMSDEERARAYQEMVEKAEAMKKDPSLRPPSKPLIDVGEVKLGQLFGASGGSDASDTASDDGSSGIPNFFQKAASGWQKAVEKQRAINRSDGSFVEEAANEPPTAEGTAMAEAAAKAARIAELEAAVEALKKQAEDGDRPN